MEKVRLLDNTEHEEGWQKMAELMVPTQRILLAGGAGQEVTKVALNHCSSPGHHFCAKDSSAARKRIWFIVFHGVPKLVFC